MALFVLTRKGEVKGYLNPRLYIYIYLNPWLYIYISMLAGECLILPQLSDSQAISMILGCHKVKDLFQTDGHHCLKSGDMPKIEGSLINLIFLTVL